MPADRDTLDVLLTDIDASEGWEPCLRSLRHAGHDLRLTIVVPKAGRSDGLRAVAPEARELAAATTTDALAELRQEGARRPGAPVLVVSRPVVVPPGFLEGAEALLAADLRVATVSFLTNDADYLSFPHRNSPTPYQVENLDEVRVTQRLRERSPVLRPAPVPLAVGPMTLLAGPALDALGVLPQARTGEGLVAAVSVAAQRKGFTSIVDLSTFYSTPHDSGPLLVAPDVGLIERRTGGHPGSPYRDGPSPLADDAPDLGNLVALLAHEEISVASPFGIGHRAARAKVLGVRVGIDGSCFGPRIMGTQVQTLSIVEALADHDEVAEVVVAVPGPPPPYARPVLTHDKVRIVLGSDEDVSAIGHVDVLHRPFQPQRAMDFAAWRAVGHRIAVSILDIIAYRNPAYHASGSDWMRYRGAVEATLTGVDGVTTISADVKDRMLDERLPVDADRIHVVELGTDHLTGAEAERAPVELLERGFVADEFLLVLGASYAHKNRDQAIRAVQLLRSRGRKLGLVLVGAAVPHGSSRRLEALALADDPADWLWTIPDVTEEERNWLLRHAAAVLYPTSAEGFGFVPFEAAQFDTPTLCVPFGPLAELSPDLPVIAESWDPTDLADAVERVLSEPATARAQIRAILTAGSRFTWSRTASKLVAFYRELLASPHR